MERFKHVDNIVEDLVNESNNNEDKGNCIVEREVAYLNYHIPFVYIFSLFVYQANFF